jgi:hypothetical protein
LEFLTLRPEVMLQRRQHFVRQGCFLGDEAAAIGTLAVVGSTRATLRRQVMIANFLTIMRGDTGTHHIKIRAIRIALGGPWPYTAQTLSHGSILIVSGFQPSDRRNQGTLDSAQKLSCVDVMANRNSWGCSADPDSDATRSLNNNWLVHNVNGATMLAPWEPIFDWLRRKKIASDLFDHLIYLNRKTWANYSSSYDLLDGCVPQSPTMREKQKIARKIRASYY